MLIGNILPELNPGQIIIFGIILGFIFLIILYLIISQAINLKQKKQLINKADTYRVFIIKLNENKVLYFNRSDPKNIKTISFEDFLKHYNDEYYYKLNYWINALMDKVETLPHYLYVNTRLKSKKNHTFFSILELTSIDYEGRIIHLNSYILNYITPHNKNLRRESFVVDEAKAQTTFEKLLPSKGSIFLVRFYYLFQDKDRNYVSSVYFKKLKDRFSSLSPSGTYMIDKDDQEIILYDTRNTSANEHLKYAHSLVNLIKRYIATQGLNDEVSFSIGVVEHKFFPQDYPKILSMARLMAQVAENNDLGVALYDSSFGDGTNIAPPDADSQKVDQAYEISYRPIIDLPKGRITGYFSYINFKRHKKMTDFLRNATSERKLDLTQSIVYYSINKFERILLHEKDRIFLSIPVFEEALYFSILLKGKFQVKDRIVLVIDEEELLKYEKQHTDVIDVLKKFLVERFRLGLVISNTVLSLSKELYSVFDYFIFDHNFTADLETNDRSRLDLITAVENLKQFKKKFIATDLIDIDGIELVSSLEIDLVSSDLLTPTSGKIIPLSTKTVNIIKQFKEEKV